jgi:hypothetical protein
MKQLLRISFVLALFLGFASNAHATGVNFHVQVLDPNICVLDSSICAIVDNSAPIDVSLNSTVCQLAGVPGLPSDPGTYGCAVLFNLTSDNITSVNLTFSGLGALTFDCPTEVTGSIFSQSSCGSPGNGVDTFSFFDGSLAPLGEAVIYESGVSPDLFQDGTGTVNQPPITYTPEPDSLLLFSTGVMMFGLYLGKERILVAFNKK